MYASRQRVMQIHVGGGSWIRRSKALGAGIEVPLVALVLALFAYLIAPVSYGDKHVYVPEGRELDATQACLLIAAGIDKLLADPRSFYDTAILYPDRNQLRSTEPFLGYVLLGLPLRVLLRLRDVDLFEGLRWGIVFTSLTYAYLLYRALGIGVLLSLAGALLSLSQPGLAHFIERLQVLCIPLILPAIYHGLMVWSSEQRRLIHSAGLFFFVALYPLCGAINATIAVMAVLFVLPLLLNVSRDLRRRRRLGGVLVPIVLATVVDAIVLAPWLLDRSDLRPYVTDAFLGIKHWNPMNVPLRVHQVPQFIGWRVGWAVPAALTMLLIFAAKPRTEIRGGEEATGRTRPAPEKHLLALPVAALAVIIAAAHGFKRSGVPWLGLLLDIACVATLLMYWRAQIRMPAGTDEGGARHSVLMLSAGLAVFLCFMSFGPVYASNIHPLATNLMRLLLETLPPLKAIREYDRIWTFGVLFLSVYATTRLGMVLSGAGGVVRILASAIVVVAMLFSLYNRPLVASASIEAPKDFVAVAFRSPGKGAIYVHPVMHWNSRSGVLMIASARALGRPIVNGSLGICPPWFIYATDVLHRFPDPEALWLLRKWKVETVVGVTGDVVGERSDGLVKVYDNGQGPVVWEVWPSEDDMAHPSIGLQDPKGQGYARIDGNWSQEMGAATGTVTVKVPAGFAAQSVEVRFRPSIVERIPDRIEIYTFEGTRRVNLNQDRSGEWIESLAADALLRREAPVAMIRLNRPVRGEFQVEFRNSAKPPTERIVLIGEWHGSPW
jgi:hypothetical protein